MTRFSASVKLDAPASEVFAWHERPGAIERLTPPWEHARVAERSGTIHDGDRVVLETAGGRWEAVHEHYVAGREFTDRQVRGPFSEWVHTHRVTPDGDRSSTLEDEVNYELPLGALGRVAAGGSVARRLQRMFGYRHRTMKEDLARHAGKPPLTVAVTGASGLIGSALCAFLSTGGHRVLRFTRGAAHGDDELAWDPARGTIDAAKLEGIGAVVHLAGENVGARWTRERKQRILESRERGTRLLAETIARLTKPPRVLVSASAIGWYGDRGGETDESGARGEGFLADVCAVWEAATAPAKATCRVVNARFGVVLTPAGGALERMLAPFRAGLGGRIGSGAQPMSWVTLDDAIYAVHHAIYDTEIGGPMNVVAPGAVSNGEFTQTLARVLERPAFMAVPAFAVKLAFGEMGESAVLGGVTVRPVRLLGRGFRFAFPDLESALRHVLGHPG